MTLAFRNRLLLLERFIFIFFSIIITLLFFIYYFKNEIIPPPAKITHIRPFFLRYQFNAVIVSIFVFMISVIVISIYIYRHFIKTRATEIFFFCAFLGGCFTESTRMLFPINGLWQSFSPLVICIGQTVVLGRILCPLSFLFIALLSEPGQRLNEERNIVLIVMVSMVFGAIIPINSAEITGLCILKWGYARFLTIFRVVTFMLAGISMYITNKNQDISQTKQITAGYAAMITGYVILCHTDTYLKLMLGIIFFTGGSYTYLANLHRKYLWL